MKDILDQRFKDKVQRVIDFCKTESIEIFSFTDLETPSNFSVEYNLKLIDDDCWHLIVSFYYVDFSSDKDDIFFYKIENKIFIQVETFYEE